MWPSAEPTLALGLTALAGWLWGSYLNQLVDRTPYRSAATPHTRRPPGPPPDVTLWRPQRSLCFACRRPIPWYDNVPVVSWLLLRGRCRACGAPFGVRTLAVELATPLLLVGWHGAVLSAEGTPALLVWGLAAASWLLVATVLWAERRRPGAGLWIAGALLAVAGAALVAPAALTLA